MRSLLRRARDSDIISIIGRNKDTRKKPQEPCGSSVLIRSFIRIDNLPKIKIISPVWFISHKLNNKITNSYLLQIYIRRYPDILMQRTRASQLEV